MTNKAISPLRRRLIEDMAIRRLSPKTQYQYIRHVKKFADYLGRSADKATAEDVHRYQLWLASIGTTVGTANVSATALRFFFKGHTETPRSCRGAHLDPRASPPSRCSQSGRGARLLALTTNIKHKAALSLAYATGLRSSEVVSLKLTDIDSDRMVIRVEQGMQFTPRRLAPRARPCNDSRRIEALTQARMRKRSRRTLASSSFASRRCFTRSPILTMPFSSLFSITGK